MYTLYGESQATQVLNQTIYTREITPGIPSMTAVLSDRYSLIVGLREKIVAASDIFRFTVPCWVSMISYDRRGASPVCWNK